MTDFTPRVPPHSNEAETSVLGSLLLDNDQLNNDAVSELTPAMFYREGHRKIFAAMREMQAKGDEVELIGLQELLAVKGQLDEVGGLVYLIGLSDQIPTAAYAENYARIVKEKWTLREVISQSSAVQRVAYDAQLPLEDILAQAAQIGANLDIVAQRGAFSAADVVAEVLRDVQAGTGEPPLSTGLRDLDDQLGGGLYRETLNILAARPSMGKALRDDQRVLTPSGWHPIASLQVGDEVYGSDGRPHKVLGVYPQGIKETFRVSTIDGASVVTCAEHLWATRTKKQRKAHRAGAVVTTAEIRQTLQAGGQHNHTIPFARPIERPDADLPLDPWVLGLWLGDGCAGSNSVRLSNVEADVVARFAGKLERIGDEVFTHPDQKNHRVKCQQELGQRRSSSMKQALEKLGLADAHAAEKFIPAIYLFGSKEQRLELLRGLADSDGYVTDPGGMCLEISTVSDQLRDGIVELVQSLGGRATWQTKMPKYSYRGEVRQGQPAHRITASFPSADIVPVSSEKHLKKWRGDERKRGTERAIVSVEPLGNASCTCITVSAPDSLFVTEGYILTHNSACALNIAENVAEQVANSGQGGQVVVVSLEMRRQQLVVRLLSSAASIHAGAVQAAMTGRARLTPAQQTRFEDKGRRLASLPLTFLDDAVGDASLSSLPAKLRRQHKESPLRLVVVDYLQLMTVGSKAGGENRQQEVSTISRTLKQLARELGCPFLVLSQLSRAVEQRPNHRPMLSDLRESGAVEQDADTVMFIYRDEYYNPDTTDQHGIAEIIVGKQREGAVGTVKLQFHNSFVRFADLARGDY